MVLPNTSNPSVVHQSAFTLIEIMIVLGLIALGFSLTLYINWNSYDRSHFARERDTILGTLYKARSHASNNMCFGATCTDGKPHGVYFGTPGEYVIFQGTSYETRDTSEDEVIHRTHDAVGVSGLSSVVFSRLRAEATLTPAGQSLTITGDGGTVTHIHISGEGRIWWEL